MYTGKIRWDGVMTWLAPLLMVLIGLFFSLFIRANTSEMMENMRVKTIEIVNEQAFGSTRGAILETKMKFLEDQLTVISSKQESLVSIQQEILSLLREQRAKRR